MPIPVPGSVVSNTAVAPESATRVTPAGVPDWVVVLKPLSVTAPVPSATLVPVGNTNMCWVRMAPSVRVKWGA